jgi:hypothetical protein
VRVLVVHLRQSGHLCAIEALERSDALLANSAEAEGMHRIGLAVVDFHRAVYAAERDAMRKVLKAMEVSAYRSDRREGGSP